MTGEVEGISSRSATPMSREDLEFNPPARLAKTADTLIHDAVSTLRKQAAETGMGDIELAGILTNVGHKDLARIIITDMVVENSRGIEYSNITKEKV